MQWILTHSSRMSKFSEEAKKIHNATFSDDESDKESEYDQANGVVAFTTRFKESSNYELLSGNAFPKDNRNVSDDDLSDDSLIEAYKNLYLKWIEESHVAYKHKQNIEALTKIISYSQSLS